MTLWLLHSEVGVMYKRLNSIHYTGDTNTHYIIYIVVLPKNGGRVMYKSCNSKVCKIFMRYFVAESVVTAAE